MKTLIIIAVLVSTCVGTAFAQQQFPIIKDVGGYWPLPQADVQPDKTHQYRAIFEATHAADTPADVVPALEDAAALVNGLAAGGVPTAKRKIAVVFYGAAAYGLLDNASYRQKYGADNPNLKLIGELHRAGVELFLCGQWLKQKKVEALKIAPEIRIATDAFIVLVTYQNRGYARLTD
jgi:intracellular sulfur oxidation DsrE/DsrF family protein